MSLEDPLAKHKPLQGATSGKDASDLDGMDCNGWLLILKVLTAAVKIPYGMGHSIFQILRPAATVFYSLVF